MDKQTQKSMSKAIGKEIVAITETQFDAIFSIYKSVEELMKIMQKDNKQLYLELPYFLIPNYGKEVIKNERGIKISITKNGKHD